MLPNKIRFSIFFVISNFFVTQITSAKVVELTTDNVDKFIDGTKFMFIFFYASWDEQSSNVMEVYGDVAEAFETRKDIVIAKGNGYEDAKLATRFWVDRFPSFRFFIKGSKTYETYKGGRKADDLVRFIQARSILTFNKEIFNRPVIELETSNFERIVKDKTKNVLVFYYNGFCKLCRKMQYVLHQLGQTFSNEPACVISRLDCDANPRICLDQLIPHFPTVKIYTRNNKDGYTYEPGKNNEFYSETNMTTFVNALCKTQRISHGRLDEKAGRLEEFDELALQFMKDWERREHILRQVKAKSITHDAKEYANYYAVVMGRVITEGAHVIGHEIERLERLIAGQVHPRKVDDLEKRKNILKQFHGLHHKRDEL